MAGGDRRRRAAVAAVAWLSLDAADADLRRFLTHLVAALRATDPRLGADALDLLDADGASRSRTCWPASSTTSTGLRARPCVALDDYHVIDDPAVARRVTFLLDNLPPQVTLAITTRADPPLPLSRLRARGELLELRAADLRFTAEEADAFLNEVMGLRPGAGAGGRPRGPDRGLGRRAAAGRAVGARPPRARGAGVDGFVEAFTGSHRFVLDYLLEEVLAPSPTTSARSCSTPRCSTSSPRRSATR